MWWPQKIALLINLDWFYLVLCSPKTLSLWVAWGVPPAQQSWPDIVKLFQDCTPMHVGCRKVCCVSKHILEYVRDNMKTGSYARRNGQGLHRQQHSGHTGICMGKKKQEEHCQRLKNYLQQAAGFPFYPTKLSETDSMKFFATVQQKAAQLTLTGNQQNCHVLPILFTDDRRFTLSMCDRSEKVGHCGNLACLPN